LHGVEKEIGGGENLFEKSTRIKLGKTSRIMEIKQIQRRGVKQKDSYGTYGGRKLNENFGFLRYI